MSKACPREECGGTLIEDLITHEITCTSCSRNFMLVDGRYVELGGQLPDGEVAKEQPHAPGVEYPKRVLTPPPADTRGPARRRVLEEHREQIIEDYLRDGEATTLENWHISKTTWKRVLVDGVYTKGLYVEWGLQERDRLQTIAKPLLGAFADAVRVELFDLHVQDGKISVKARAYTPITESPELSQVIVYNIEMEVPHGGKTKA